MSGGVGVVACGAIAADISAIAVLNGWDVEVRPLPPLLHNHPHRIADEVEAALDDLSARHTALAVAYADCGTYGALDDICERRGVPRLGGAHCYDVYAGQARIKDLLAEEPGTYLLTDFLVLSFRRTILAELGLDRRPELRDDYFKHYRRVVWLSQRRTPELQVAAAEAASALELPLEIIDVGLVGLTDELRALLASTTPTPTAPTPMAPVDLGLDVHVDLPDPASSP